MPTPIAHGTDAATGSASRRTWARASKVCGITEIRRRSTLLAGQDVDFVGLWHGVPGGPADLPLEDWQQLARQPPQQPATWRPYSSRSSRTSRTSAGRSEGSHAHWVQLHGYPTPGFVARGEEHRARRARDQGPARARAGMRRGATDRVLREGRRRRLPLRRRGRRRPRRQHRPDARRGVRRPRSPNGLRGRSSWPAASRPTTGTDYAALAAHPRFLGIDVDTNARGPDGKVSEEKVAAISRAWKEATRGLPSGSASSTRSSPRACR